MLRFNLLKFVTEVLTCVTCALIPQQKLASVSFVSFATLRKLVWHNVTEYYMQSKVFKSYRHKLPFLKAILCFYSVTGFEYWKNRFLISFPRTSRWKHLNLSTPQTGSTRFVSIPKPVWSTVMTSRSSTPLVTTCATAARETVTQRPLSVTAADSRSTWLAPDCACVVTLTGSLGEVPRFLRGFSNTVNPRMEPWFTANVGGPVGDVSLKMRNFTSSPRNVPLERKMVRHRNCNDVLRK